MPLFGLAKKSIPPDRLDVDYLSAISADMGTLIAGQVRLGYQEITRSG